MGKKISALLFAAILSAVGIRAWAFYDTYDDEYGAAAEELAMYGVLSGRGDGGFYPDDFVKRSELAKMAVIIADEESAPYNSSLFYDVDKYHWAGGYINAAARSGILQGYPNGSFAPEKNLSYAEAITVILRLLGYGTAEIGNNYPIAYLDKAYDLGLTRGLDFYYGDPIDRKNTALIISRALMTEKNKSSVKLIEQLDFTVSDECVILPGYLTAGDEVSTSIGIYKTFVDIKSRYIGKKAKLIFDKDENVVAVRELSGDVETITVQNITGSDISYTSGGAYGALRPENGARVYYQNDSSAFSAVKSEITPGMKMTICRRGDRIDYIILHESELYGPYIITSSLAGAGIDYAGKSIMKNGVLCDAGAVENCVAYYDDECVYIYDNKVTGIYEKASPYKSDVKGITLSGNEYEIETKDAADKLGNGADSFALNDYITLILGKDGKIADVLAAKDAGEKYPIVSVLENDIVYIKDGKIDSIKAENNWRINYGGSETTFGNIKRNNFENALFTAFYKTDGGFDYGVIDEYDLNGPKTASDSIEGLFDFDKRTLRVIRDGKDGSLSDIKTNDVLYYSDIQNTVYAYCDSELGVFEEAYPNKANARSIKLSGVTYEIETKEVLQKLKNFEKNDYMTLLLGKDGKVADIKSSGVSVSGSSSKENRDVRYGILLSCRSGMDDGTRAYYATFMNDVGKEIEYKTDKSYEDYIGRAAELVFNNGALEPKFLRNSDLSGAIDKANASVGGKYLSDSAVIVDVSYIPDSDKAKDGYPAVAKEIEFSEITVSKIDKGRIIGVVYNKNGDIDFIAFDNITNSRYSYGMVVDYKNSDSSSWYEIDLNGVVKRYTAAINTDIGRVPVMANIQKGRLLNIYALTEIRTSGGFASIDKQRIKIGDVSYRLDKNFVIYTKDNNKKWSPVDIDDIDADGVDSVRIYADKDLSSGGIVRIVVINGN